MTQRFFIRFPTDLFEDDWIDSAFRDMDYLCNNYNPQFPPTDILVDKKTGNLAYKMAIAGYDKDQISITTEDNCIIVEGSGSKYCADDYEIVYRGIKASDFKQRIPISAKYDLSKLTAAFSNGLLVIEVPISEEKKPKKIQIQ